MSNRQSCINLLRAMAASDDAKITQHDIIFNAAVELLEQDKEAFDTIENNIYARGITVGSNTYFKIRELLQKRIKA